MKVSVATRGPRRQIDENDDFKTEVKAEMTGEMMATLSWMGGLRSPGGKRGEERVRKKGKLSTSHRYDLLPLLPSGPGGIQRELVVYDFP